MHQRNAVAKDYKIRRDVFVGVSATGGSCDVTDCDKPKECTNAFIGPSTDGGVKRNKAMVAHIIIAHVVVLLRHSY